jgi:hypothetical protein
MSIDTLVVLRARAEACAALFLACEYEDLGEAVTPLLVFAHTSGLADEIGAEQVFTIIRESFESAGVERREFEGS